MRIQVLDEAEDDLLAGREFYDLQEPGVGDYFAVALASDIDSLILFAGIHPMEFGFPSRPLEAVSFRSNYLVEDAIIRVYAVLDLRRDPAWIRRKMTTRER